MPTRGGSRVDGPVAERVEWIEDGERFEAIGPAWEDLAERDHSPFAGPKWYGAWWRAFGAGRRLAVCALWRDAELAGVLPLVARRGRLEAMANDHTPVLRAAARDAEALSSLTRAAVEASPGLLDLHPVAAPESRLALEQASAEGRLVLAEPSLVSPIVDVQGEFAAYREPRKGEWREMERRRRKLLREHDVNLSVVARPEHLERELTELFAVEASGWKGHEGTAIAADPSTDRFYRELAEAFGRADELRLSRLEVDGRLVAGDLALVRHGRYLLLKTGYEESLRRLGVGLTLRLGVVERCFELGLDHEFLGDDAGYKQLFATSAREHVRLRIYRRRPVALTRWTYRRAARPLLKRSYYALRRRRGASR